MVICLNGLKSTTSSIPCTELQRLNAGLRSTDIEVIPFGEEAYVIEFDIGETALASLEAAARGVKKTLSMPFPTL